MEVIRLATAQDIDVLVQMRWDSSEEFGESGANFEEFQGICKAFLGSAIASGDWRIWVAEVDDEIVSNMYLQLIHKVPRPGRLPDPTFGYVTNVYTRPSFRSKGIGTNIHHAMEQWVKDNAVEFLILWPSSKSGECYARNGFSRSEEVLEKHC